MGQAVFFTNGLQSHFNHVTEHRYKVSTNGIASCVRGTRDTRE